MLTNRRRSLGAGTSVIVAALFAPGTLLAQSSGDALPRTADGRPDLSGFWQALSTAHYDLEAHAARPALATVRRRRRRTCLPVSVGRRRSSYRRPKCARSALWEAFRADRVSSSAARFLISRGPPSKKKENASHWLEADPEIKCYMPGVPRATYMPYPFQILQGAEQILMAYEFASASRTIHLNKVGDSPSRTWMGWSRGRWEGDTLVVDVTRMNGDTGSTAPATSTATRCMWSSATRRSGRSLDVRGDDRGSERLHAAVEDPYAALPAHRRRSTTYRVRVCRIRRATDVRRPRCDRSGHRRAQRGLAGMSSLAEASRRPRLRSSR